MMSISSAREYRLRLRSFVTFATAEYKLTLDDLIKAMREDVYDPYDVLSNYVAYLQANTTISTSTLKLRVTTARTLLEFFDIEVSPRKFKLKVKIPKVIRRDKQALTKEDIVNILNACSDIRLKTYVMLLAATGMRASEALCTRLIDYNLDANPQDCSYEESTQKQRYLELCF
jgi:integrase